MLQIKINKIAKRLNSLIPTNWFENGCVKVRMKIFKIDELQNDHLTNNELFKNFGNISIFVFTGEIEYHHIANDNDKTGDFLLLILKENEDYNHEFELKQFSGLLSLLLGINITRKFLFNFPLQICNGQVLTFSSSGATWKFSPINGPNLDEKNLSLVHSSLANIEKLEKKKQNKIKKSLFWFSEAQLEKGPIAFLKYWIAIETLVKDKEIEIKERYCFLFHRTVKKAAKTNDSISRRLQEIYGLKDSKIRKQFQLKRLGKLRALTAHHGRSPILSSFFLKFCEMLYLDLFHFEVNNSKKSLSIGFIQDDNFDLEKILKEATK